MIEISTTPPNIAIHLSVRPVMQVIAGVDDVFLRFVGNKEIIEVVGESWRTEDA